jgi:hypothetical protein
VQDKQALVFKNGSTLSIRQHSVYTNVGTSNGGTWTRIPLPTGGFGPRCSCDMNNDYKPGDYSCGCRMGEEKDGCSTPGNCSSGHCEPCPETAGSDCSRCYPPPGQTTFTEPCDHDCIHQQPSVLDVVRVPKVKPGKYVVGFRYDSDATAQVWSNCADITIE